ncbi:hypothetical protein GDO86_006271 [Hymenochirus boettgeri]|uniref:PHD-type domain-containing protein n=1 Tax=Hymenochirus boettgeri TaxID=247094 RepID=A0A8T2J9Q8_9PIPI|nr:hypothetical protein GDO86_006271 [Hymenochirus boettgeri]
MSAEQEKQPCKRKQGDDGIVRTGLNQGSPEKKKRKSNIQVPLNKNVSEYAPPAKTSSDHLIASNPFDDDFISPSPGYPFFSNHKYSGIEDFSNFRIPPNSSPTSSTQYYNPYHFKDQIHPFTQDGKGMAFGRTFSMGMQENANVGNQIFFNTGISQTITMPGQHFRCNRDENFIPMTMQSTAQMKTFQSASGIGFSHNLNVNQQLETSHNFLQSQSLLMYPKTITTMQDFQPASRRYMTVNTTSQNNKDAETIAHGGHTSHKSHLLCAETYHSDCAHLINISHTNGMQARIQTQKLSNEGITSNEKCNRWLLHSAHCGNLSSDMLYSCGICSIEVRNFQDALMCEASCQKWFHRSCTGMTEFAYALLNAESSAIWGCDSCLAKKDIQLMLSKKSLE